MFCIELEHIYSTVKSRFSVRGIMAIMKNENREAGFGKRLADLRKQRGLTQQLCELVGVHVLAALELRKQPLAANFGSDSEDGTRLRRNG